MRILLDSRDLIDLTEHDRPVRPVELQEYLRNNNHTVVLTFTNVRELASPLANGADFLRIRRLLQSLEALSHTYIGEVSIPALEIQSGIDAFSVGGEYQPVDVYATRWDRTFAMPPGQQRSPAADWINLRLDEIVYFVLRISPHVFTPPTHYLPALRRLLEQDRELLRSGRAPARQHFINSIRKLAMSWNRRLPAGREDEFATWIYSNPSRCPGLRLQHETYRALMANYGDVPETADFSDLTHVCGIPYVEAATLDNRMRHYAGVAARKLVRMGSAINFRDRMFTNLAAIMQIQP